jgi:hypothetical protein
MQRTMSILATAALGAMLAIGPTTSSMAQMANAQSGTGDASLIYVRGGGGGGGGGHGGGGHGGFGGGHGFGGHGFGDHGFGDHGFGGHGFSGGFSHDHFDHGFRGRRDFRGGFWGGWDPGYCYYYDPYYCW